MRTFRPRVTSAITAATLIALAGVSGAALTNDFIELANAGSGAAALDGWSVQYISASPGATTTWQVTPLTGSLSGGGLYLIGEAADTSVRFDQHVRHVGHGRAGRQLDPADLQDGR